MTCSCFRQIVLFHRSSPPPSLDYYRNDENLHKLEADAEEPKVERHMQKEVFVVPPPTKRSDRKRMFQRVVPHNPTSPLALSIPVPDSGYGYSRNEAFADEHRIQLLHMGKEMEGSGAGLIYPFLAIKFKADGPFQSSGLWVATNQCLGAESAYVSIAETLKARLHHVRNIIEWGATERLAQIHKASDALLEAGRLDASAKAKLGPPPVG
ncbi:hypothetical protein N0V90_012903 [Kalmusia sp. IMI 367209]|nr:hypothetical protein N0V90_012903 [Kalmusia sp. IMI 367209]